VRPLPNNDYPVGPLRRGRVRNACLHLLVLPFGVVFLCLFGGQALASGLSAPTGPSAVAGAISGTLPQSSVASPTVLPVSVGQHPSTSATTTAASVAAPLAATTSDATPVSSTATAAIDDTAKTAEPAIHATAKTAGPTIEATAKTAGPTIDAIAKTAGPTIHATTTNTAIQRTEETVSPAIAATQRTARTVVTTAGSTPGSATATVAKQSAPVLAMTGIVERGATSPVSQTPSTVSRIVRGVVHDTTTASAGATESPLASRNALLGLVSREPPTRPTGALASKASGRQMQPTLGALPSLPSPPSGSAETIKQIVSSPVSTGPTDPAGAPSALPVCAGSAIRSAAEALIVSCASAGTLPSSSLSAAQLLGSPVGVEPAAALTFSRTGADGHRGAGSTTVGVIPAAPAPAPLPQGSSGAMAGGVGVAFSIFLILAGLLLIGGLATMRLLRLASESWRMAQFVLVPERPG
jgi:hypothetical protein